MIFPPTTPYCDDAVGQYIGDGHGDRTGQAVALPRRTFAVRGAVAAVAGVQAQVTAAQRVIGVRYAAKQLLAAALLLSLSAVAQAERLKDIASISGVRSNQLIGYGLVVGLNGTGDQTTQKPFTLRTFNNMLSQFGIKDPPGSS